jgi:preprotein translocase subunit SecE
MAKQTRAQRRARRAEQERQGNGADARAVQRQAPVRSARAEPAAPTAERRLPGSGFRRFVGESAAELKKVEWPGQQQLIQGTAVVLIACVIVGAYLWVADLAFKRLVQHVFLGQ